MKGNIKFSPKIGKFGDKSRNKVELNINVSIE